MTIDQGAIARALGYLQTQQRQQPPQVQWWPAWAASQAYAAKVLAEFGRNPTDDLSRLYAVADRMPAFALSYLADALAASNDLGPRYQDVVRRLENATRVEADRAHVEEMDDDSLSWLWNSNVRATAVVLEGLSRRKDDGTLAAPLARWLMASRTNGRWGTTYENATALSAMVSYYRAFETETPQMTATVKLGASTIGTAAFAGRTTTSQEFHVPMAELTKTVAPLPRATCKVTRSGTGRAYYTTRLQYLAPEPADAVDRGFHVDRKFTVFTSTGAPSPAAASFNVGDVIRVTVGVSLAAEGKFLAVDDRLPAGFEPIDEVAQHDGARPRARGDDVPEWRPRFRRLVAPGRIRSRREARRSRARLRDATLRGPARVHVPGSSHDRRHVHRRRRPCRGDVRA